MKGLMKKLLSPRGTIAMFAVAGVLLAASSIGGIRAALTYFSDNYVSRVEMYDIGVSLVENGDTENPVAHRDYQENSDGQWDDPGPGKLLAHMLDAEPDGKVKLGKTYPEAISVLNSGTINQYVRVSIYKYWRKDGNKMRELGPERIRLHLLCDKDTDDGLWSASDSGWLVDEDASTPERTVLYYSRLLRAGEETPALSDTLAVDGLVADRVTETKEERDEDGVHYTTITTAYDYDGVEFCVEAEVDAVQEHNAQAAILSAWGRNVNIENETLGLAD